MGNASGAGIGAGWTQRQADLMIAVIACAWGSSYLMMQVGLSSIPPFGMVALRFGIAFVAVAIIFRKRLRELTTSVVARGAVLGFLLCVFFGLLMYGLKTTPASTAGFLTSAKVVFVPLIVAVATHRAPSRATLAGIGICVAGLALLTLSGPVSLGGGAGLCLAGSAVYALQIVATDTFSRSDDALLLGICQLGFAAVFGAAFNLAFEGSVLPQSPAEWGAVLGLALVCSAFGFAMQPLLARVRVLRRAVVRLPGRGHGAPVLPGLRAHPRGRAAELACGRQGRRRGRRG